MAIIAYLIMPQCLILSISSGSHRSGEKTSSGQADEQYMTKCIGSRINWVPMSFEESSNTYMTAGFEELERRKGAHHYVN